MKAFKDNFEVPTVQDWLEKAQRELKGRSLEDLSWDWGEGMVFPPIHFEGPKEQSFALSPSKANWIIGEKFEITDYKQANISILAALDMGLEGIHLALHQELSKQDWATLLDKVILTYITLVIDATNLQDDDALDGLAHYLEQPSVDWNPQKLFINKPLWLGRPPFFKDCKHIPVDITIHPSDNATSLASQLAVAESSLDMALTYEHHASAVFFQVTLTTNFYLNVVVIQSLKILWQNILDAYSLDPHTPICLLAKVEDNPALNENTQKIDATVQAISAIVAGIDYLEIEPKHQDENGNFNARINRNIQHLLKLESFMDYVENPTTGSFYFDTLTKEFSEHTWENFKAFGAKD